MLTGSSADLSEVKNNIMRNSILFSFLVLAGLLTSVQVSAQDSRGCQPKVAEVACVKVESKCQSGEEASVRMLETKVLLASMPGVIPAVVESDLKVNCQPADCKPANCQPADCPPQCKPICGETKTASVHEEKQYQPKVAQANTSPKRID